MARGWNGAAKIAMMRVDWHRRIVADHHGVLVPHLVHVDVVWWPRVGDVPRIRGRVGNAKHAHVGLGRAWGASFVGDVEGFRGDVGRSCHGRTSTTRLAVHVELVVPLVVHLGATRGRGLLCLWAAWGRRVVSHQLAKLVQRRRASSGDGSQEVGVARRRDVKGRDLTGTHGQLGERWRDEELAEGEGGGCLSLKVKEQHDDVKGEGRVLGSNRTRSTTTGHRLSSWELPTKRPNAAGQARYIVVVRP